MTQADPCEWYQCFDPPTMTTNNMRLISTVNPIPIYENITYECLTEGLFFESDRDVVKYTVQCQDENKLSFPAHQPACVKSKRNKLSSMIQVIYGQY